MTTPTLKQLVAGATKGARHVAGATIVYSRDGTICECGEPRATTTARFIKADLGSPDSKEIYANADLIARLSPELALAVYEALEHMKQEMIDASERTGVGKLCEHTESWQVINRAMNLLDGLTP